MRIEHAAAASETFMKSAPPSPAVYNMHTHNDDAVSSGLLSRLAMFSHSCACSE